MRDVLYQAKMGTDGGTSTSDAKAPTVPRTLRQPRGIESQYSTETN